MKVRITIPSFRRFKRGDVLECTRGEADIFVRVRKVAEYVEEDKPEPARKHRR